MSPNIKNVSKNVKNSEIFKILPNIIFLKSKSTKTKSPKIKPTKIKSPKIKSIKIKSPKLKSLKN